MSQLSDESLQLWQRLNELGPRPMGSQTQIIAVEEIEKYLESNELPFVRQAFNYSKWVLETQPYLELSNENSSLITSPEALIGCPETPPEGIQAQIIPWGTTVVWETHNWVTYAGVDATGNVRFFVSIRPDGVAIPQAYPTNPTGEAPKVPHFVLGQEYSDKLLGLFQDGLEVKGKGWLLSSSKDEVGYNLVVSSEDKSQRTPILIGAHYDTVYCSPGAYDNTSGVIAVLELAKQHRKLNLPNIQYMLFGAEEQSLLGSKFDAQRRSTENALPQLVIVLDGMGRGDVLEAWVGPESLMLKIQGIIRKQVKADGYQVRFVYPPPSGSDHTSYYHEGTGVLMLTFNDQEIIHTPKDTQHSNMLLNVSRVMNLVRTLV